MLRNVIISRLIVKCDLRRGFSHVHIFEKGAIGVVLLLLDSGAKFEERVRNILFRCLQNVDQPKQDGQSRVMSIGVVEKEFHLRP
jgi:hypothetical protein